ncbi:MAG: NAD(P)H-dependent oxidoreductase subunit E, partial [Eubacteriales bacterium]
MSEIMINNVTELDNIKKIYKEKLFKYKYQILVCGGAGCISSNCGEIKIALDKCLEENDLLDDVCVTVTGCMGTCAVGPVLLVMPDEIFYTEVTPEKMVKIVESHIMLGQIIEEYTFYDVNLNKHVPKLSDIDFFKDQVKIALRNCGAIDYSSIDAYIANDGYYAIANAVSKLEPIDVVEEVKLSGLRGRGGGGFPTGIKWEAGLKAESDQK